MSKRSQLISETFVYMLTIVIVGLILVMGYKYISTTKKVIDKGELLQFQSKLASDVKSVGKDYGRFKQTSYSVPSNLNEICFVDLANVNSDDIINHPIIKDSIESAAKKNIFLFGENSFEALYIENFQLNYWPYYSCFQPKTRNTEFKLEGLGNAAVLQAPPNKRYCQNAQSGNLCDELDTVFGSGYKSGCCKEYSLCC